MKIAIIETLTIEIAEKLQRNKVGAIIYLKHSADIDLKVYARKFKLIYAYNDVPGINDYSHNLVSRKLGIIKRKIPGIFVYKGYDLTHALEKDVFWGLLEENAVRYQLSQIDLKENEIINYFSRKSAIKRLALIKKLFIGRNVFFNVLLPQTVSQKDNQMVAFRINELTLPELYGDLIAKLKGRDAVSYQTGTGTNNEELHQELSKTFKFNIQSNYRSLSKSSIGFIKRLRLCILNMNGDFLNVTSHCLFKLMNDVDQYEKLAAGGIRNYFVAAGENEGEGNVICAVAKKYGGTTFNYMNGAKAREKINVNTWFTYWFMPNQSTQELILSYCDVTKNQVPVIGHLLEEKAYQHQYTGLLNEIVDDIKSKKIIAFFTSIVFVKEQADVLNYLEEVLKQHNNVVVVIRKHPADKRTEIVNHPQIKILPDFTGKLYNQSLYDLMCQAHISISFSSTVSLQSTWFNLPTVNYEYSEKSVLPYVDNKKVMHVNGITQLNLLISNWLLSDKRTRVVNTNNSTSDRILEFIWPVK